jgi:hypothetical protein
MARPRRPDSARVPIGLKVSEEDAARIDRVLARPEFAGWSRSEWCREIIRSALRYYAGDPPAPDPGPARTSVQLLPLRWCRPARPPRQRLPGPRPPLTQPARPSRPAAANPCPLRPSHRPSLSAPTQPPPGTTRPAPAQPAGLSSGTKPRRARPGQVRGPWADKGCHSNTLSNNAHRRSPASATVRDLPEHDGGGCW